MAKNVSDLNNSLNNKFASKSHGNHVPTTQTANNAKFLRNDNTWQTVTPANIGAATSSQLTTTNSNIGTLSSLQTSNKSNLVAAINEVFQSGANAKQKLVDALVAYGVTCSTSDSWDTLINHVAPKDISLFIIKNNELNSAYSFYNVSGTSGSSWKYNTTNGLYTNNSTSSNYEYVTTNQKINFSKIKSIKITAKCSSTEHASGYKIWATSVVANALNNSSDVSQAIKQSDFVPVGNTYVTRTFDVSSWTGEYYLGITRNSYGGHTFYVKDIELISESGGAGTLEDLLSGDKNTIIDEELLLLDKGTEYNTNLSGGIWTAAGIALTSGTGLVITPQSGKYKCFTFRNKINLSNYTALEITVKCPAGSTEIGFVIDDTSVLGGTYSSYGNATTTRPRAISTDSTFAGGTKTYVFNFAELYDRTGISFDRSLYIGFAFGYASGNYTITNIKLRNNRTVPNKMNIISAASLPATGEEGQICVITDNPVDSFMMSSDFNDVTTGENSIVLYLGNTATGDASEGTLVKIVSDNLTMNYYLVKVCQGENRLNSYIYQNGAWKSLTQSAIYFIENGVERNNSYFGGVMASSKGWSFYNDNEKGLVAHGNVGYNEKFCTPNNKINFSLYNYIEVKASVSDGVYIALTLGIGTTDETRGYQFPCNTSYNSIDVGYATSKYIAKSFNSTSGQTIIYDISSWTGEGYLVIHCFNGGYGRYFRILDMKFY